MSSALRRSTRARTGPARAAAAIADAAEEANESECPLFDLMGVPDYCEVLCEQLDTVVLSRFRVSRGMLRWIDPLLEGRGGVDADVAAGVQQKVLRHLCAMENRRVRLARGEFRIEGDQENAEHLLNEPRGEHPGWGVSAAHDVWTDWKPEWRKGYGPLAIAA